MNNVLDNSPAEILRQLLIDLGLGIAYSAATTSWQLAVGQEPNMPTDIITLYDAGGSVLQGRLQNSGNMVEKYGVQVRVRSDRYQEGWKKANAIASSLDTDVRLTQVSISNNNYLVYAINRIGGVISIGSDKSNRSVFTLNLLMTLKQES